MKDPVYLGIDLGTQSVKAMAVTEDGRVAAAASAPLTSSRENNRHEQNAEEWWSAVSVSCRSIITQLGGAPISGIAVDATSGTIVLTDAQLRPCGSALMYDDGRATAEAEEVNRAGYDVWQRMSYRMQPSWALPKIVWLSRRGLIHSGNRILHQNDFINARMAGTMLATDSSHALKTGYDQLRDRWPEDVLHSLKIDSAILPNVVRPGVRIGETGPYATQETGIPAGTHIYAGMTDGCAAQIASGAVTPGSWNSVIGTTLVLKGVTPHLLRDPHGVIYSHRSPDGMWLPGGASSVGAGIIAKEFKVQDLANLNHAAENAPPSGVVMYPLSGRGERFPFANPDATGFTLGVIDSEDIRYHAILEGIACTERLCVDVMAISGVPKSGDFFISGGATKSEALNQIRADVLCRSLIVPSIAEAAFGMAILAASSADDLSHAAKRMVHIERTIEPTGRSSMYFEQYQRFIRELEKRGWIDTSMAAATLQDATL
jgi:sugar (pentulose or hexulose) kinase